MLTIRVELAAVLLWLGLLLAAVVLHLVSGLTLPAAALVVVLTWLSIWLISVAATRREGHRS